MQQIKIVETYEFQDLTNLINHWLEKGYRLQGDIDIYRDTNSKMKYYQVLITEGWTSLEDFENNTFDNLYCWVRIGTLVEMAYYDANHKKFKMHSDGSPYNCWDKENITKVKPVALP